MAAPAAPAPSTASTAAAPAAAELTPGQLRRASNVVMGLIFRGMNDFCARDITEYHECSARPLPARLSSNTRPRAGQCGREAEMMGSCRLLVSDSLHFCDEPLAALTEAIARKEEDGVVQALTDRVYKCGMTPLPGFRDPPSKLPLSMVEAVAELLQEQKEREEFLRVVRRQVREEWEEKRGHKKAP